MRRLLACIATTTMFASGSAWAGGADRAAVLLGSAAVVPDAVMACSSVEAAVADGRVLGTAGSGGPGSVLDAASEDGALAPATPVAVAAFADGSHRVDVAFDGTRDAAEAWLATLSGVMFASTGSWSIVRGGGVLDVVLASGSLSFADRGSMASQRRGS